MHATKGTLKRQQLVLNSTQPGVCGLKWWRTLFFKKKKKILLKPFKAWNPSRVIFATGFDAVPAKNIISVYLIFAEGSSGAWLFLSMFVSGRLWAQTLQGEDPQATKGVRVLVCQWLYRLKLMVVRANPAPWWGTQC